MPCLDVRRAHFHKSRWRVFTTVPPSHEEDTALLPTTKFVTEDAAAVWQESWTEHVKEKGFHMGSASSALFAGAPALRGLCHGADLLLVAARRELEEFEVHLSTRIIGQGEGCVTRWTSGSASCGATETLGRCQTDPRHVTELLRMVDMEKCKPTTTPR